MRAMITSFSQLTYDLSETTSAVFWRLESEASIHLPASITAAVIARAGLGDFCVNSAGQTRRFSGWALQRSLGVVAVKADLSMIEQVVPGSPNQKSFTVA